MKALLAVLVLAVALAACGKRPGTLVPEETGKPTTYPRTYPTR